MPTSVPAKVLFLVVVGLGIVAPALFVFVMMQYGAITFPFWDHWEIVRYFQLYYDESLWSALSAIFAEPHNHSRPVVFRLIIFLNGILTGWDIRSEYVYLYLVIYGGFLIHLATLSRLLRHRWSTGAMMVASMIALLYFSPGNHNNYWWSFMLLQHLATFFTTCALFYLSSDLRRLPTHACIAAACWLATFSLTNGLFLTLSVMVVLQAALHRPVYRFSRYSAFWLANAVLILLAYFPVAESGLNARPPMRAVLHFIFIYVGNPLAVLLDFPYRGFVDVPKDTGLATSLGVILVALALLLGWANRRRIDRQHPEVLIFFCCALYVALSAGATAWGRAAVDQYGVRTGLGSRYVTTSSFLLFGMLYLFVKQVLVDRRWLERMGRRAGMIAVALYVIVLLVGLRSYGMSERVYETSRAHNATIAQGFQPDGQPTPVDGALYPIPEVLQHFRDTLLRLKLGPYRYE